MLAYTQNKILKIGSTRNAKKLNGVKFQLETGTHLKRDLQEEWKHFGKDSFHIEVLEPLTKKDSPYYNEKEALQELEDKWLEHLMPFGEREYNKEKSR